MRRPQVVPGRAQRDELVRLVAEQGDGQADGVGDSLAKGTGADLDA